MTQHCASPACSFASMITALAPHSFTSPVNSLLGTKIIMSFNPQTPQSPSQSSPSTTDSATNLNSSMTSSSTALPTPAHSVNGSSIPLDMAHDMHMADDSPPQKRKRPLEDVGEREQKKVHIEDHSIGINDIHLDVGPKYLLCKTPHPASRPRLSDDFIAQFSLAGIAADVARVLPNGEKNAIRKTYKGHIRKLGVNGHFDSVKSDPMDEQSGFLSMVRIPEDVWTVRFTSGREVEKGLSKETLGRLGRAVTMAKGTIPKSIWDSSVLGELAPGNPVKAEKQTSSAKATAPSTPSASAAVAAAARPKPGQAPAQEAARPRRAGKKRSYGDSSFEGYGDGFPDDDFANETGYSTGEGEAGQLKRRKKNPAGTQPYAVTPQQSYGPGMVGR